MLLASLSSTLILKRCQSEFAVSVTYDTTYPDVLVDSTVCAYNIRCRALVYNTLYRASSLANDTTNSSVFVIILVVVAVNFTIVYNCTLTVNLTADSLNLTDNSTH